MLESKAANCAKLPWFILSITATMEFRRKKKTSQEKRREEKSLIADEK
jgi:hypothetical protein